MVGALAYTFSDTFWFSAVEGEVYASSSLFTALVFWAILKWENEAFEKYANRWLILIAYLMGLSIGVHLLNLLAIPAIVMVYYFRKFETSRMGLLKAGGVAVLLLGGIMYGIIPGVMKIATWFELLFVNSLGFPYNTGLIVYALLLIGGIVWGLRYTLRKQKVLANTILTGITVILIGFSSYAMVIIRSSANPPLDENNPEDVFSMLPYLNREQYGKTPLIYGQYFNAGLDEENPYSKGSSTYSKKNGRYEVTYMAQEPNYDSRYKTIFPRMYSKGSQGRHQAGYAQWSGVDSDQKMKPTFAQNLRFFFRYQLNHMYIRYFMWNFAGRQDDIQSHGGILNGNWISGIPLLDNWRLGDQSQLPESMKNNPARNQYFLLPLLLGLLGMITQYRAGKAGKQGFWVISLLFFFTGVAIVLYLNQPPFQPRERDYAYAGSFYAFAIWIGIGVLGVWKLLRKLNSGTVGASLAVGISLLAVPTLMAQQNWDDHDRSDRYMARDLALNYLNSCELNAILFTMGDNDTFQLWYLQEVEGIRTDVRVCNLSYLATDWYIEQMSRKAYDSDPLPFSMKKDQYILGKRDVVYLLEDPKFAKWVESTRGLDIRDAIAYVASDKESTKRIQGYEERIDHMPAKKFRLPIDKNQILATKTLTERDTAQIVDQMEWSYNGYSIYKNELMVLDLLANNQWKRPVYFAITVGRSGYMNMEDYFQQEGFAYRLVPVKTVNSDGQVGRLAVDTMYHNLMENFQWGNINDPDVYLDENHRRLCMVIRNNFLRLADALLAKGEREKAVKVMDRCFELVSGEKVPYDFYSVLMTKNYYMAAEYDKANQLIDRMSRRMIEELNYFYSQDPSLNSELQQEKGHRLALLQNMLRMVIQYDQPDLRAKIEPEFEKLVALYKKG
jgi:hypothetical protein